MKYKEWINYCHEDRCKVLRPIDVYNHAIKLIKDFQKEHFLLFCLDSKNRIIHEEIVGIGIVDQCLIHPREIFKTAILNSSTAIIIAHNHPSGDIKPSIEDDKVTERIKDAGELIGIKLLDHIIIGCKEWYSYDNDKYI